MKLIYTRSPFFVKSSSGTEVTLSIRLWQGSSSSVPTEINYNLSKPVNATGNATFEVSELIRDYVEQTFSGSFSTNAVWLQMELTDLSTRTSDTILAVDGYVDENYVQYWETFHAATDVYNLKEDKLLISNEKITIADDTSISIPVNGTSYATFFKDGVIKFVDSKTEGTESDEVIQYLSSSGQSAATFYSRVILDGGTIENEDCADEIMEYITELDVDEVILGFSDGTSTVIEIETAPCNKYENSRLVFVNKFGALQHIDFSAKNTESTKSKGSNYKSFNFDYDTLSNNYTQHSHTDFNKNATISHTLNTDFVHESYSEVFRQLLVSEQVWLDQKGSIKPVNVQTGSLNKKTHANDGLVQFTVSVSESHNLVNNIR
jgi:hypothetical protein